MVSPPVLHGWHTTAGLAGLTSGSLGKGKLQMTRSSVKGRMPYVLGSAALAVALAAGMAGVSASSAGGAGGNPGGGGAPGLPPRRPGGARSAGPDQLPEPEGRAHADGRRVVRAQDRGVGAGLPEGDGRRGDRLPGRRDRRAADLAGAGQRGAVGLTERAG